jgi:IclR family acetate operon transcriptional repressor
MEAKLSHQSLERGLRVIEAISDFGGSASVSAIARKTGLPRSTVHHLLRSLIAFDYLLQGGEAQPYKLAPRLFKLTGRAWTQGQLAEISVPFIDELSRRTGEGTSLAILREGVVSVVAKRDSEGPVRVVQKVGTVRPIYCTAVGKILAAWLPEREIDDIIGRIVFERITANTITAPAVLKRELARIRANGFAVDNEEHIEGIRCIAAPVRDHSGAVCAALCIVFPAQAQGTSRAASGCGGKIVGSTGVRSRAGCRDVTTEGCDRAHEKETRELLGTIEITIGKGGV